MNHTIEEKNKELVLKAFDTLFNKRDYAAAERYWSPNYIQHSAHIEPGRDGLFNLIKSIPPTLRYEPGVILAEGDFVIVHGRFSDFGLPVNWIAADILRIEDGILVEHWDVIQDEASREQSKSGLPMFGVTSVHRTDLRAAAFFGSAQNQEWIATWTVILISTAMLNGNSATPMVMRVCMPRSPKIATRQSEQPFNTFDCSVNPGALFTAANTSTISS